jgi:hypothetical protein
VYQAQEFAEKSDSRGHELGERAAAMGMWPLAGGSDTDTDTDV